MRVVLVVRTECKMSQSHIKSVITIPKHFYPKSIVFSCEVLMGESYFVERE